ncbi:nucleotidyltransferase family protein [Microvirga rosea]|nr:nucleotidyltransferase family protein [Microvirga rosea]
MRGLSDISDLIEAHAPMRGLLAAVASLRLPDAWIGAGFVRNAVWDALHERAFALASLEDVDVVFFDPANPRAERDHTLQENLGRLHPGPVWQVKNQARMHVRNGDGPYDGTADAIARWPETATAIAARLVGRRVEIMAPHGVDDLLALKVRPTPAFLGKMDIYRERLARKNWAERWPKLTFVDGPPAVTTP